MRMKVSKAIRELSQLVIALSYQNRSDEVEITPDLWFKEAGATPLKVFQRETFQPTIDELKIGDVARFDYTAKDGKPRIRVGKVVEVNDNDILIFDYYRNEYRKSKWGGIENVAVLRPS